MTYQESNDLMRDPVFIGRVKVACLRFADSISNDPKAQAAPNTMLRWAQQTMQQPDFAAQQTTPPTVMDGAVQAAGADITDAALQGSVEAVVKKMI